MRVGCAIVAGTASTADAVVIDVQVAFQQRNVSAVDGEVHDARVCPAGGILEINPLQR